MSREKSRSGEHTRALPPCCPSAAPLQTVPCWGSAPPPALSHGDGSQNPAPSSAPFPAPDRADGLPPHPGGPLKLALGKITLLHVHASPDPPPARSSPVMETGLQGAQSWASTLQTHTQAPGPRKASKGPICTTFAPKHLQDPWLLPPRLASSRWSLQQTGPFVGLTGSQTISVPPSDQDLRLFLCIAGTTVHPTCHTCACAAGRADRLGRPYTRAAGQPASAASMPLLPQSHAQWNPTPFFKPTHLTRCPAFLLAPRPDARPAAPHCTLSLPITQSWGRALPPTSPHPAQKA